MSAATGSTRAVPRVLCSLLLVLQHQHAAGAASSPQQRGRFAVSPAAGVAHAHPHDVPPAPAALLPLVDPQDRRPVQPTPRGRPAVVRGVLPDPLAPRPARRQQAPRPQAGAPAPPAPTAAPAPPPVSPARCCCPIPRPATPAAAAATATTPAATTPTTTAATTAAAAAATASSAEAAAGAGAAARTETCTAAAAAAAAGFGGGCGAAAAAGCHHCRDYSSTTTTTSTTAITTNTSSSSSMTIPVALPPTVSIVKRELHPASHKPQPQPQPQPQEQAQAQAQVPPPQNRDRMQRKMLPQTVGASEQQQKNHTPTVPAPIQMKQEQNQQQQHVQQQPHPMHSGNTEATMFAVDDLLQYMDVFDTEQPGSSAVQSTTNAIPLPNQTVVSQVMPSNSAEFSENNVVKPVHEFEKLEKENAQLKSIQRESENKIQAMVKDIEMLKAQLSQLPKETVDPKYETIIADLKAKLERHEAEVKQKEQEIHQLQSELSCKIAAKSHTVQDQHPLTKVTHSETAISLAPRPSALGSSRLSPIKRSHSHGDTAMISPAEQPIKPLSALPGSPLATPVPEKKKYFSPDLKKESCTHSRRVQQQLADPVFAQFFLEISEPSSSTPDLSSCSTATTNSTANTERELPVKPPPQPPPSRTATQLDTQSPLTWSYFGQFQEYNNPCHFLVLPMLRIYNDPNLCHAELACRVIFTIVTSCQICCDILTVGHPQLSNPFSSFTHCSSTAALRSRMSNLNIKKDQAWTIHPKYGSISPRFVTPTKDKAPPNQNTAPTDITVDPLVTDTGIAEPPPPKPAEPPPIPAKESASILASVPRHTPHRRMPMNTSSSPESRTGADKDGVVQPPESAVPRQKRRKLPPPNTPPVDLFNELPRRLAKDDIVKKEPTSPGGQPRRVIYPTAVPLLITSIRTLLALARKNDFVTRLFPLMCDGILSMALDVPSSVPESTSLKLCVLDVLQRLRPYIKIHFKERDTKADPAEQVVSPKEAPCQVLDQVTKMISSVSLGTEKEVMKVKLSALIFFISVISRNQQLHEGFHTPPPKTLLSGGTESTPPTLNIGFRVDKLINALVLKLEKDLQKYLQVGFHTSEAKELLDHLTLSQSLIRELSQIVGSEPFSIALSDRGLISATVSTLLDEVVDTFAAKPKPHPEWAPTEIQLTQMHHTAVFLQQIQNTTNHIYTGFEPTTPPEKSKRT
ncbi:hypothetical protein Pelo_5163 [Pelomyxa schiedti]|nr:hypothetical protein Pelo_5163 [Pelomyxa schiedti]